MLEDPKIVLKRQEIIDLKNKIKELEIEKEAILKHLNKLYEDWLKLNEECCKLEERNNYLDDYVCYLLGGYTEEEFMKLVKEKYVDKKEVI